MATVGGDQWVVECSNCSTMFRDSAEDCGVCPRCGHENAFADE